MPKKNQQIEDSLLEAWLDDDELLGSEINVISLTPSDFWASSSQNERLDGDVFYEEIEGATIGDSEANKRIVITFNQPTLEMTKLLKPLYVKAYINVV